MWKEQCILKIFSKTPHHTHTGWVFEKETNNLKESRYWRFSGILNKWTSGKNSSVSRDQSSQKKQIYNTTLAPDAEVTSQTAARSQVHRHHQHWQTYDRPTDGGWSLKQRSPSRLFVISHKLKWPQTDKTTQSLFNSDSTKKWHIILKTIKQTSQVPNLQF